MSVFDEKKFRTPHAAFARRSDGFALAYNVLAILVYLLAFCIVEGVGYSLQLVYGNYTTPGGIQQTLRNYLQKAKFVVVV